MGASPQDADGSLTTAGDTWARALAGMDDIQLARGLKVAIIGCDDGWPLNLPMFRAACLGIPGMGEVRREIETPDAPRSGFAVLVWSLLDPYAFRRAEGRAAERMLKEAYDEARERVMRGEPVPAPYVPLPPPEARPAVPARPEVARAALAEIASLFPPGTTDPVAEPETQLTRFDDSHNGKGVDTSL